MRTRHPALALLCLPLLAGCGGGNQPLTSTHLGVLGNKGAATISYTVTDLGATYSYYPYNYYGSYYPFYGLSRYNGNIAINKSGQIVSSSTQTAAIYLNGTLTDLTPVNIYSSANSINDAGQVAGQEYMSSPTYADHAFLWQANGQGTDLGVLAGYYSDAYGISNSGLVVGDTTVQPPPDQYWTYHGFIWQNGHMTDLGTLPGGDNSHAQAVNDAGQVVGWSAIGSSANGDYQVHAFVWQNGTMTDLGTLPGGSSSDVSAINNAGQAVGSSNTAPQGLYSYQAVRATLWQAGGIHDLGTLGGPGSIAFSINSNGAIVGAADTGTVEDQNFYYYFPPPFASGGGTGGNPAPGSAGGGTGAGGNSGGQNGGSGNPIRGGAGRAARALARTRGIGDVYVTHAFIYTNGQMTDLNTMIDSSSGWELLAATGVNDNSQIVGFGLLNKRLHAFLLTPK